MRAISQEMLQISILEEFENHSFNNTTASLRHQSFKPIMVLFTLSLKFKFIKHTAHLRSDIHAISDRRSMVTSSNGNIFRATGPFLCGEFTGHGEFPAQWPVTRSFDVFFDLRCWVNNREAGDLKRHRAHYDVSVMEGGSTTGHLVSDGMTLSKL